MAKFRESNEQDTEVMPPPDGKAPGLHDRSIGEIIRDTRNLSAEQVEKVLEHQRTTGKRFGEAAVALGYVSADDVLFALAQQFHYPYAPQERRDASPELVMLNQPFSVQAESFRAIRSQVTMRMNGASDVRSALAVISPDQGDGKSYFSANLAVALAQLGGRTLLIDADMRGPRLHSMFNIGNESGLSGILSGRVLSRVIQSIEHVPGLFLLPVGATPPNPLELIERPAFALLMKELTSKFDHVIVDTPAMIYGADAGVIAARCGGALVVARKNRSRTAALQDMVASLAESPAKVIGVILNEF